MKEIAVKLSNYEKVNKNKKRTVIFTQGANQTIVCVDGEVCFYFSQKIPRKFLKFFYYFSQLIIYYLLKV